ncbi:MAG TPA: IS66 family insertion sequence element accessory protein TnpB [Prolixibacteraceae bacterium]|nr:IS66 family insertion sequence element accessory protein TnpB [Prolixibacteraceae bacterium]
MFSLSSTSRFFLYKGATDMRKSFDGLCGIVQGQLHRNPMSGDVFIFINRRRDKIKLLQWEQGGFVLYYKRIEAGTIEFPPFENHQKCLQIKWTDLVMMIEGISLKYIKKRKRFFIEKSG